MAAGAGAVVPGYSLKRLIGEGGMALVYLAERLQDGEEVVLKILREELSESEDFRRRFLRESRYAAALDHPNVVKVFEAGEAGDALYMAMQYVEGSDLYGLLEQGTLEAATAVAILAQVGAALDAAHLIGLVHRDVKPGNVLIASAGDRRAPPCFLTDFGLSAQRTKDSRALTTAGSFVGTIAYTAPEQMIGPEAGAAADVYSLGCVLFECLAGKPPFEGSELEVMQAHIESAPPKLSKKRSPLPPEIDVVIQRAMAKEPGERYPTCADLVEAAAAALGVQVPSVMPAEGIGELAGPLQLLVTAGNSVGDRIQVGEELVIGRDEPGEGTLGHDPEISRRHARISRGPVGGLLVEDLGSTNGVFLNGRQTMGLELLSPGDEIELGSTKLLVFVAADEPEQVEPATVEPSWPAPEPAAAPEPVLAGRVAAPAERTISRVSLRIEVDPRSGEARLHLDRESEPIRLVRDGARWRVEG